MEKIHKPLIFDLHSHSCYSDGELQPTQLVTRASQAGVNVLALTDHDTTAGLHEAQQAAQQTGITLISGVEISTDWKKHEIHIIGLNIDADCAALQAQLAAQLARRSERALTIAARLQQLGIADAYAGARQFAGSELIARPHFAKFLVMNGHAKDISAAFRKFLGRGKPAHVPAAWPTIVEAVAWIKQAGGQAILAHPARYRLTAAKLRILLQTFKEAGGVGLEVITGYYKPSEVALMADLGEEFNLLASQGSDFHGDSLSKVRLGVLAALPAKCRPVWYDWGMERLAQCENDEKTISC